MKQRLILEFCLYPLSKNINGWNKTKSQPHSAPFSKRRMCKLQGRREDGSARCLESLCQ